MARVLIATEDATLQAVLAAECAGEGHDTLWALNGQEALELGTGSGPDLVFLDPVLAVFSGVEACGMLREDPEVPGGLPIFLLTDDDVNPHTLARCGATGVFPKTHAAAELRELLADQLQHADRLAREREGLQG